MNRLHRIGAAVTAIAAALALQTQLAHATTHRIESVPALVGTVLPAQATPEQSTQPPPQNPPAESAQYVRTQVKRTEKAVTVTFDDKDGKHHEYTFTKDENASEIPAPPSKEGMAPAEITPLSKTEWHWWGAKFLLNRKETKELETRGANLALLYAIGTAAGCGPCAVGAAAEGHWGFKAGQFYRNGNCIHINMPYMTVGETKHGKKNCK